MKNFLQKLFRNFLKGLLLVAPFGVTIYILVSIFNSIDSILEIKISLDNNRDLFIPGLGFLIIVFGISIFGYFSSKFFSENVLSFFEKYIQRIPLIGMVYFSIKDLVGAFVGDKKKFDRPVIVLVDEANNIKKLGFITQSSLLKIGEPEMVMVYFPQSYAVAGDLIIIEKSKTKGVDLTAAEAMKLIVSGGVS